MNLRHVAFSAALATLAFATAAPAVVVPGGGKKKTDCFAGFEVDGTTNSSTVVGKGATTVEQKACDNSCTFTVSLCINEPVAGCTASAVSGFTFKPPSATLPLPVLGGSDHVCGDPMTIVVPQRGKKIGKKKFKKVIATAAGGKDPDTLLLRCLPNKDNAQGSCPPPGGACASVPSTDCPANPAGGPNELVLKTLGTGTDLDNGWTGTSHNFPVIKDAQLKNCLTECDETTNPVCKAAGPTGAGSINGVTFGPPLPLISGGVAVCVQNYFDGPVSGTFHLDTGVMEDSIVNLKSEVFVTTADKVCPRCQSGTCDNGPNRGKPCTPNGSVNVANAQPPGVYQLSNDCPQGARGSGAATLTIPLRPNSAPTMTPGAGGSKPCTEKNGSIVNPQDDACGAAGCGSPCSGNSCVRMVQDPTDPTGTAMICQDVKGGLSQTCCNGDTTIPCFPTRPGGPGIVRKGKPVVPGLADGIAWPNPTYPKDAEGLVTASTFCIPGTGQFSVDQVAGLPGPGAVTFNVQACVYK